MYRGENAMHTSEDAVLANYLRALENQVLRSEPARCEQGSGSLDVQHTRDNVETRSVEALEIADLLQKRLEPFADVADERDTGTESQRRAIAGLLAQELRAMRMKLPSSVEQFADYLARQVVDRLRCLAELRGQGAPVRSTRLTRSLWWSRCPKGHLTDEYLWLHQCL